MVAKLRAAGAYEVIQYGAAWKDADAYLKEHIIPYVRNPLYPRQGERLTQSAGTDRNHLLPTL
jgi:hypothetical protein